MSLIDPSYQLLLFTEKKQKLVKSNFINFLKKLYKKSYKKMNSELYIPYYYNEVGILLSHYSFFVKKILNKKKYYNYLSVFLNKPKAVIHVKNSSVNTYLTFSIDGKVIYAKSAGALGYRKKYRRVKVAAYKLGRDLASKLVGFIKVHNIQSINIALEGYFRFLNAIISSIKRELSKYIGESCESVFFWRGRLRDWNRKKKNVELRFRKVFKPTKSQLRYEKHIEEQVKKYKIPVGGLRSLYDYTSVDHGGIKKRIRYSDKRYW